MGGGRGGGRGRGGGGERGRGGKEGRGRNCFKVTFSGQKGKFVWPDVDVFGRVCACASSANVTKVTNKPSNLSIAYAPFFEGKNNKNETNNNVSFLKPVYHSRVRRPSGHFRLPSHPVVEPLCSLPPYGAREPPPPAFQSLCSGTGSKCALGQDG